MNSLLLLALLGLALWFWQNSLRARDQARQVCARLCQQSGVQLLDDTVALQRLWLRRDPGGRLRLHRTYVFEFSDDGLRRRRGSMVVSGGRVQVLSMDVDEFKA